MSLAQDTLKKEIVTLLRQLAESKRETAYLLENIAGLFEKLPAEEISTFILERLKTVLKE